jgi:hypothetical protein
MPTPRKPTTPTAEAIDQFCASQIAGELGGTFPARF